MSDDRIDEFMDERDDEARRRDERLDAIVRGLAMDYHRPPATPREAMWDAVAAGLGTGAGSGGRGPGSADRASAADGAAHVIPMRSRAPRYTAYALAASLLLAAGIGIGVRLGARGDAARQHIAANTPAAPRGDVTPAPTADSAPVSAPAAEGSPEQRTRESGRTLAAIDRGRRDVERSSRPAIGDPGTPYPEPGTRITDPGPRNTESAASVSYQLATVRHLTQVEALLTSFRDDGSAGANSSAASARADAQLAAWARELLTNTRLLLDSPAAADPLRRHLLEDLELVLVQIVQLAPGTAAEDRASIERTLSHGHVMTRLRTAIPAGQSSGI